MQSTNKFSYDISRNPLFGYLSPKAHLIFLTKELFWVCFFFSLLLTSKEIDKPFLFEDSG